MKDTDFEVTDVSTGLPVEVIDVRESGNVITITCEFPEKEVDKDFLDKYKFVCEYWEEIKDKRERHTIENVRDNYYGYRFQLAVLLESECYPFEDIGFNLDQWIDWLFYHNYSIEEAAKILDERDKELLLIYASKQKGL